MPPERGNRPSITWLFLLGVILAIFGTLAGRYWDFTVDDAGISFAYARNLANGHGLVMTPGSERVEAATNLLWCLILAPARWLGGEYELLSKVLGLAGAAGALASIAFFPSVAYQRRPAYYDLVAPLITALLPHFALWSVSGLETGFFAGLGSLALVMVAREENDPKRFPWSSLVLFLLFMTRPDGALYAVCVGAAKVLRQVTPRPRRQDVIWMLALAAMVALLEVFRLAYFAWPFPNSFYTKKRTFDFGKDLFDTRNAGWNYVGRWLQDYKLTKIIYIVPLVLVGMRAAVARITLFAFVIAAFFFPIYSHGDWMEEYRFLALAAPWIMLGLAEAARAAALLVQPLLPKSVRSAVAFAITPFVAYGVLSETTKHYPQRMRAVLHHETLEFNFVRGRARYFVSAAKHLHIDHTAGLLDPDVGGSSFDGRLQVIDLFGLGDIPIAHTHPDNPPGSREAIFWERRPTFVHLHGAWFGAMELHRLEEIEQGYVRLPGRMPDGESEADANYVRRDEIAAPWYGFTEVPSAASLPTVGTAIDAFTVSHRGLEPRHRLLIDVAVVRPSAQSGAIVLTNAAGGRALEQRVDPAGGIIGASDFIAGERPRARVQFEPAPGLYHIQWRSSSGSLMSLGDVRVAAGAGVSDSNALRNRIADALRGNRTTDALALARTLGLRVVADPADAIALDGLARYGQFLADRAWTLATQGGGALRTAALLARQARAWAAFDSRTRERTERVAERLADEGRAAERRGDVENGFVMAREAVLTDPRRSWSRRRAEELRPRRLGSYDGARDQQAYRFAAGVLAGTDDFDAAIVALGSVERWVEAAALAERVHRTPTDPHARVVLARGLLSRGQTTEALALVSGLPCESAHDPELTRGLRAVFARPYRPGDAQCDRAVPAEPAPFDGQTGSFESPTWGRWHVTGTAFGAHPLHTHPQPQQFVNGWRGWQYANSFATGSDLPTGTLRSPEFVVHGDGISFLIGGGDDVAHLGVRLVIDGHAVLQASGHNSEGLKRVFWNVRPYAGQHAVVEVYDNSSGGWGHVSADDFRVEPVLPSAITDAAAAAAAIPPPSPAPIAPPRAAFELRARPR